MKKLIILVIVLILTSAIWAGVEIESPKAEITKYYVGSLTQSAYNVVDSKNYLNTTWRAGVEMKFQTGIGEFSGFSVFNSSLNIFSWTWNPVKYLYIGHGGRPVTYLHRAHPVSPGSHFEPRSLGIIPGSAPNVRICVPTKNSSYHFGVWQYKNATGDRMPEVNLGISRNVGSDIKSIISGYYNRKKCGGVITLTNGRNQIMLHGNSEEIISSFCNVYLNHVLATYVDMVFENHKVTKYEIGTTWDWSVETGNIPIKGLLGLSYIKQSFDSSFPGNSINLYLFVYTNK